MMPRLSLQTAASFANTDTPDSGLPNYLQPLVPTLSQSQTQQQVKTPLPGIGIVHLGPGAFFRGHQAWYTHRAMQKAGGNWRICAVSLRTPDVAEALDPQDGLYTLAVMEQQTEFTLIGAIAEVLVATTQAEQVLARLTAASTSFVTMTITEKGYCLTPAGGLDLQHPDIQHDLKHRAATPKSAIGWLVKALKLRFDANVPPFVVISCDNLTDNGKKLKAALLQFAEQLDPALVNWLSQQLISPSTMVDSITPATDDALRELVTEQLGYNDAWPVKREQFCQWVIEDVLPSPRPAWEQAGVIYTSDVRAFEKAKLRLLNAPHSTLAYLGVLLGLETVEDAVSHQELRALVRLMTSAEILPSFIPPAELNAEQYSADIFRRFENPSVRHLLAQIAWDGSQKLPMRILPVISDNLAAGRSIKLLALAIASWLHFLRLRASQQPTINLVDPLAARLLPIAAACVGSAEDVDLWLAECPIFPEKLCRSSQFKTELTEMYQQLAPIAAAAIAGKALPSAAQCLAEITKNASARIGYGEQE